jgi:hypothetical protein
MSTPAEEGDHWHQLSLAEAWRKVAELLALDDREAAGVAWSYASEHYAAYREAYDRHLPVSRWDYDYGPEHARSMREGRPRPPRDIAASFAPFVAKALDGQYDEAALLITSRPARRVERAIVVVIALALEKPAQREARDRLFQWGREAPLSELGAELAKELSQATGEPLSHLDYPRHVTPPACVTIGMERDGLWRAVAIVLDLGRLRGALVPAPHGGWAHVLDVDVEGVTRAVALARDYVRETPGSPASHLVNVGADLLQILWDGIIVPRAHWALRFDVTGELSARASVDLEGPEGPVWRELVTIEPGDSGVALRVAGGVALVVSSAVELLAVAADLLTRVRSALEQLAAQRASTRGTRRT